MRVAKAIEAAGLEVRSYFLPSHIWTYWQIVQSHRGANSVSAGQFVYFNFTSTRIDHVGGRYLFALVRDFEALGMGICYHDNFPFLASFRHKQFKAYLLQRQFRICRSLTDLPEGAVAAEVTDEFRAGKGGVQRRVRVRYDEAWPTKPHQVPMSFFVHPRMYDQWLATPPPDLRTRRPWRIFFAGRANDPKYRSEVLPRRFGKMSRAGILQVLADKLPPEQIRRPGSVADLKDSETRQSAFVWPDATRVRVPQLEWLRLLERGDFFLACPGMDMPLCHNLIEALSRGMVPILEHPEFLDPPLQHNVNCLVFRGPDQLLQMFDHALKLNDADMQRLREGAYAYYHEHHTPGAFARRLLAAPHTEIELFLNAYRAPHPSSVGFSTVA